MRKNTVIAFKKISAVLLALAMVLSMVPLSVLAVDYPTITGPSPWTAPPSQA